MIELYCGYDSLDFLAQSKHRVHYATHSLGFIYLKEKETERERSKNIVRNHRSRSVYLRCSCVVSLSFCDPSGSIS